MLAVALGPDKLTPQALKTASAANAIAEQNLNF
jgi:hypothetical protein